MSSRYAPVDEVRILTGGVDLFAVVYELAAASATGGIWVEAFGTVRGASIIELTGDRHRESVREATLSSMTATVFMNGDTPDIRSVGTLTWRDKRTPQSLTGFVASALCTHVTLRIRPIAVADAAVASRPAPKTESAASAPAARSAEKPRERAASTPTDSHHDRLTDEARALDAAVVKLAESTRAKRESQDAQVQSWADLAAASADESPTLAATPRTAKPVEASTRASADIPTWADLASDASLLNERAGRSQAPSVDAAPVPIRTPARVSSTTSSPAKASAAPSPASAPKIATPAPAQASFDDMSSGWGSWDDVAAVSDEVVARAKTAATELKRGEVIVHPTLGNCTVLQVMSEHVVMVKPKQESARKITLKLFDLLPTKKAGIYELVKR